MFILSLGMDTGTVQLDDTIPTLLFTNCAFWLSQVILLGITAK